MGHHIENGTLFIDAGEPYLEHHGVLGMKWGKHLRAGKGPASAPASSGGGGGGAPEEDEETKKKIEEAAKKAGMSVAEYKQKFASKIGGAGKAIYNAAGGNHKTEAARFREMSRGEQNKARQAEGKAHENSAKAASQDRKYGSGGDVYRRAADMNKRDAEVNRGNAKMYQDIAQDQQSKYEKSLAGRYDKMKADRARSKKLKQRQSIERALSNGPVEAKPKKGLGKRLEEKLGVTHERTNKPKQSKEAKRIEGMFKAAARKDKAFSGTSPKEKKRVGPSKLDKARYAIQRGKQKAYNAAGGKYKEGAAKQKVFYDRADARMRRAKKNYDRTGDSKYDWDRQAADSMRRIHNYEAGREYSKYRHSLAGRYDEFKKKRKKKAKHFDDTNAIYTEGTRLVINSKWG